MRCLSCNARLRTHEATRRMVNTGSYVDLCDHCFATISSEVACTEGTYDTSDFDNIDEEGEQFGPQVSEEEE